MPIITPCAAGLSSDQARRRRITPQNVVLGGLLAPRLGVGMGSCSSLALGGDRAWFCQCLGALANYPLPHGLLMASPIDRDQGIGLLPQL